MTVTTLLRAPFGYLRWRRLFSDRESVAVFRALRAERGRLRALGPSQIVAERGDPVSVNVRALDGARVVLRPGTSDVRVLEEAFRVARNHVPPEDLVPRDARRIWDLGANIGLVAAHYALLYPQARIVAVELEQANAESCRINTARWADRVAVVQAAVWTHDGLTSYTMEPVREYAARVSPTGEPVSALSLDTLLESNGGPVDFVKMDIEGAEAEVLREKREWASEVACMKVEAHHPYTPEACATDLERIGFRTRIDRDRIRAVLAWRDTG
jgi:FkbM family methyltransferase